MDRSNIITIATCALTGTFITVFIARQIMKAIVFRKVAIDDLFILLATVCTPALHHNTHANSIDSRGRSLCCDSPPRLERPGGPRNRYCRPGQLHHEGILRLRAPLHIGDVFCKVVDTSIILQRRRFNASSLCCPGLRRVHLHLERSLGHCHCIPMQHAPAVGNADPTLL
jgi:hypothetical protein